MAIHTCPRCDLRFEREAELEAHLVGDHSFDPEALHPTVRSAPKRNRTLVAVVGNHTLLADAILEHLRTLLAGAPVDLHVVVPVRHEDELDIGLWRGRALAERLASSGGDVVVTVDAGVGDPVHLVERSLHDVKAERIVLSTFPPGLSKWLEADVAGRLRHDVGVPVEVVTAGGSPA